MRRDLVSCPAKERWATFPASLANARRRG